MFIQSPQNCLSKHMEDTTYNGICKEYVQVGHVPELMLFPKILVQLTRW